MAGRFGAAYLTILGLLVIQETSSLELTEIKVPAVVKSGDSVTMKCEYDMQNVPLYSIKWYYKNQEFYRYVPRQSPPSRAFPLPNNINVDLAKSTEDTVTLREVQRQLSGKYSCEVSSDAPLFHTATLGAHMIVVEIPKNGPILNIMGDPKVEKGKFVNAECSISGSDPAANMTWYINNNQVTNTTSSSQVTPTEIHISSIGLKSSKSKISFVSNKSHFVHGVMSIRCVASIFDVWTKSSEDFVRDDSPKTAQVLGSTQLQSQVDPIFDSSVAQVSPHMFSTTVFIAVVCLIFR